MTSKGDPSCNYIFLLKYLWLDPEAGRGSANVFQTDIQSLTIVCFVYIFLALEAIYLDIASVGAHSMATPTQCQCQCHSTAQREPNIKRSL